MLYSYKYFRKEPLELMELYCYHYGAILRELDRKEYYRHKMGWLQKAIKICKARIERRMHD